MILHLVTSPPPLLRITLHKNTSAAHLGYCRKLAQNLSSAPPGLLSPDCGIVVIIVITVI